MLNDNTSNMRSKAAPHPCSCADEYGCDASLQILKGSASTGELKPLKNKLVPKIVIINGAVSPAILDTAKTIPVVIPLLILSQLYAKQPSIWKYQEHRQPPLMN